LDLLRLLPVAAPKCSPVVWSVVAEELPLEFDHIQRFSKLTSHAELANWILAALHKKYSEQSR